MLGDEIDKKVQLYIQQLIQRGDVILRSIAVSVATDLLEWDEFFGKIKITETWAKSLLKLMGFVRRAKTSWTVETPEDASKEIEYQYLYQIVNAIEKWDIYPDLVVNFDQAPSKLAPVGRFTLAKRNSTNVTIAGSSNKKNLQQRLLFLCQGIFYLLSWYIVARQLKVFTKCESNPLQQFTGIYQIHRRDFGALFYKEMPGFWFDRRSKRSSNFRCIH